MTTPDAFDRARDTAAVASHELPPAAPAKPAATPRDDVAVVDGDRGGGSSVLRLGLRCGLVAAAATAGAIVGFSLGRDDGAAAPFATSGRMLLGVPSSDGAVAQWGAVVAGVLLHCAVVVAWAIPFVALARGRRWRRRGVALLVTAALYAALAYVVSERALPALLRLGHGARAFPPQLALLYTVLAVALAAGMRIAFSR